MNCLGALSLNINMEIRKTSIKIGFGKLLNCLVQRPTLYCTPQKEFQSDSREKRNFGYILPRGWISQQQTFCYSRLCWEDILLEYDYSI